MPPFQIVEEDSVLAAATEIVTATFSEAGIDFDLEAFPWDISYQLSLREKNTCLYSVARLPSREASLVWIGWIANLDTHFYASALSDVELNDIEDAKKYRVAAIKDDAAHHYLLNKGFVADENLYVHHNYQTLLKLLDVKSRNIDLVMLSETLLNYREKEGYKKHRYKKLLRVDELTLNFYLACNPETSTHIIESLTGSMRQLESSGALTVIRTRWQIGTE